MELDLTPKKYTQKKKKTPKRRRGSLLLKHWNNPFQRAIIGISLFAFVASSLVERYRDRVGYEELFGRAVELVAEAEQLDQQATETYQILEALTADKTLKQAAPQEAELSRQLDELNHQLDRLFLEVNSCYTNLAPRYRKKYEIKVWGVEFVARCINSALSRNDHEQARLWFNASAFNIFLQEELRDRIIGQGSLEITADDRFEDVAVFPVKSNGPQLVLCDPLRKLREFPAEIPEIDAGSYLLWATLTNGTYSLIPVFIEHDESKQATLTAAPSVPAGMAYIPEGEFVCGGEASPIYREHKRNVPAFLIKTKEVTVGEYLEFWSSLNTPDERDRFMSRIQFEADAEAVPAWNDEGRLLDARLQMNYPVVGITQAAAEAYCQWIGRKLDRTVRLPTAFEWEKAARGVDGRTYPWGYEFEPDANLALSLDNPDAKSRFPLWAPVGSFSRDASIYNIYDMGGNVREMTSSPMPGQPAVFQVKGGSASTAASFLPCAWVSSSSAVPSDVGFRYVAELE